MPYVDAGGVKLYFEESGHGYPIIFIHEFASDLRGWEAQLRYFSRSYRCIAYNARGYLGGYHLIEMLRQSLFGLPDTRMSTTRTGSVAIATLCLLT
jgi:hypothetical protein